MEQYSILGQSVSPEAPPPLSSVVGASAAGVLPVASPPQVLFPGDDRAKSLAEMAEQNLEAALQLLAERAQFITGASGAAIGLCAENEMVCRAAAGPCAPTVGVQLQTQSGLTAESLRARLALRCDDAETDPRVNRDSCRSIGIRSVMVMPLIRNEQVIGVFELLADRPNAFEERDIIALERLGEMILVALEHAEAGKRAMRQITEAPELAPPDICENEDQTPRVASAVAQEAAPHSKDTPDTKPAAEMLTAAPVPGSRLNIKACSACGFPVSQGRTLCLDCEEAQGSQQPGQSPAQSRPAPALLSELGAEPPKTSWLQSHFYTIAAFLMVAATIVVLLVYLR